MTTSPKQANVSAIRIFERFLGEKGWVKKDSCVKADSEMLSQSGRGCSSDEVIKFKMPRQ